MYCSEQFYVVCSRRLLYCTTPHHRCQTRHTIAVKPFKPDAMSHNLHLQQPQEQHGGGRGSGAPEVPLSGLNLGGRILYQDCSGDFYDSDLRPIGTLGAAAAMARRLAQGPRMVAFARAMLDAFSPSEAPMRKCLAPGAVQSRAWKLK